MDEAFSPQAHRLLEAAKRRATRAGLTSADIRSLFAAILESDEGEGIELLRSEDGSLAVRPEDVLAVANEEAGESAEINAGSEVQSILQRAREIAISFSRFETAGTREILIALLEEPGELASLLEQSGVDRAAIVREFHERRQPPKLSLDLDLEWRAYGPPEASDIARIVDANLNRAREAMRVIEEYARFVLDDSRLAATLKNARHRLREIAEHFPSHWLLDSRDTESDVGTRLSTRREETRADMGEVVFANLKRCQEALRSIEEYAKIEKQQAATAAKGLRYEFYTIERQLYLNDMRSSTMETANLYWLCDPDACRYELEWTVRQALEGGVDVIQLRQKSASDRKLLQTARRIRSWTRDSGALFIMNDRPDLARLSQADGVHVGQEELGVRDVRRIVGPDPLVGVSTHSLEQARQAFHDGASYIGVGPLFPSKTKSFDNHIELAVIGDVEREFPYAAAFAIGGITLENAPEVLAAGARRLAVSHAICAAEEPRDVAQAFCQFLETHSPAAES